MMPSQVKVIENNRDRANIDLPERGSNILWLVDRYYVSQLRKGIPGARV